MKEHKNEGQMTAVETKTWLDIAIKVVALILALFHLYTAVRQT